MTEAYPCIVEDCENPRLRVPCWQCISSGADNCDDRMSVFCAYHEKDFKGSKEKNDD